MSEQTIYGRLIAAGMTPAGACGLMGNMAAESAMRSNNAQDGMTGLSDEAYTLAVDNGTYQSFVGDCVGYGLCQWTFHTRKAALLAFARNRGVSVGDEEMQVDFAVRELNAEFPALWAYLCSTDDWYEAARRVCVEFERPAVNNISVRAQTAKGFFEQFEGAEPVLPAEDKPGVPVPPAHKWTADMPPMATLCEGFGGGQVKVLQALLGVDGFTFEQTGVFDEDTKAAVIQFQHDNGLEPDGIVGKQTWTVLVSAG